MKENTNPIRARHIGSGQPGPRVLITAGVHGDEYEPMLATLELLEELPAKICNGSVTIVTVVNESAYGSGSRYGEDGLDLARVCPGNIHGSDTEMAAARISELIHQADYLVDMHTGGLMYDIAALAGYMLHTDAVILEKQQKMALACNLPIVWGTDARPEGRTLSIARDARIPAIYLEYGGGTGTRPEVVKAYRAAIINILRYLKMIPGPVIGGEPDSRFWVEDHRTDSGYLQGKMPSPADGVFVAEIAPGEMVKKGDRWGRIIDPFTGESADVFADISGLAFLQRTLVRVRKGDALGGILPLGQPGKKVIYE
ncbi:M14 family metallopeptidase [Dyadobacter sp. CY327]|uniref:succinylglutamate desuccinylase/aspartoacylase family protein n=1 Tax=Dyadobacter sp. CY327 TaxID=2907301 RepID=UPI001F2C521D|nr:M14 family metallopeptidase [Dyadobacter sp. CY327]MCE7070865.1 M14 family metallopeptidase [Dyadobacter sp. CY327]